MNKENKLELDLNVILVDIIKLDKNLQDSIKSRVKENIINKISDAFANEYFENTWDLDKAELQKEVFEKIKQDREEFIKKILKDFTERLGFFAGDRRKKAYEEFKNQVEIITKN